MLVFIQPTTVDNEPFVVEKKSHRIYSGLKLKQYVVNSKSSLEINLNFLSNLFIFYFNLLYNEKRQNNSLEIFI